MVAGQGETKEKAFSGCRAAFDIPDGLVYLNAASVAPIPLATQKAGEAGVAVKKTPWRFTRSTFYEEVERARAAAAALIGAEPGDIAIVGSASYGVATAAANLPLSPDRVVLTIESEHASPLYMWLRLAEEGRTGHEELPLPEDYDWTRAVLERLEDKNRPPVGILSLTPLHWNDGARIDLEAVRAKADETGAALLIDGTQAIGATPFSVRTVRPDFLVFPTYKWLLGPYGLAFLYADPARQNGKPLEEHAFSRQGADKITNVYGRELGFMPGARRYDMGERSNFVTLPMAIESLALIRSIGVEVIAGYLSHLTRRIAEGAAALGFQSPPGSLRASHLIGLRHPEKDSGAIVQALAERGVFVSARNNYIRVAPHIYNDAADIERFLDALAASS